MPLDSPRTPYLGRYLAVSAAVMVGIGAVNISLRIFTGYSLPSGAASIIPPMIAALHVGQVWGRDRGSVPDNRTAWRWAGVAGLVYLALQMLIVPVVIARANHTPEIIALVAVIIAGVTLAAIVINRLFLTMGAKGAVAGPRT
ncbi:hypothetical protein JANAI62_22060 [Jannaschia pagri]|uniref:GtrA-like protein n=1 Tax=Jannaschia pagri TaxID=2829797 RepID=A0ABQ4NMH2_9RHOB|nr:MULTISPECIES: ABZJ_00895 family protein [unclassified Jannaschia]GIT95583.1 hypothetical protein JANAI62_22060 [Jannaschia sp. AI_62]